MVEWGITLQGGPALLFGSFEQLPAFPYRPGTFRMGTGWYGGAMGVLQYRFTPQLALSLAGGYQYQQAQWRKQQSVLGIIEGTPRTILIEHTLLGRQQRLTGALQLQWSPFSWLSLGVGPILFYPLHNVFQQQEAILTPPNARFVSTGERVQELFSGQLEAGTPWVGIYAAVGVPIPLGYGMTLVPELSGTYALQSWWQAGAVREYHVGAALRLLMHLPPPVKRIYRDTVWYRDTVLKVTASVDKPTIVRDTVIVTVDREETETAVLEHTVIREQYVRLQPEIRPFLAASVRTSFVLETGVETDTAQLQIEELLAYDYVPLLNYVFFALYTDTLPSRYHRLGAKETRHFSLHSRFFRQPMDVYHHLLNIVGFRLRRFPHVRLRIVGCNAGEAEGNDQRLARRRARAVQRYLHTVWGIPLHRLPIAVRNLPAVPSPLTQPASIEENARVELQSDDPDLFAPVELIDTLRIADPPTIRFRPRVVSEAGIAQWRLWVWQNDRILFEQRGKATPPEILDWEVNTAAEKLLATQPINYRFEVVDSAGQHFQTPAVQLHFREHYLQRRQEHRIGDRIVERYTLILFDFDKAELKPSHRRYLDWVRQQIPPGAQVRIVGTTDTLGDAQYNRQLSLRRAQAVASYLGMPELQVRGNGEAEGIYAYPEERFYRRTVHIIVEFRRRQR